MKSTKNSYEKERKKNTAAAHFSLFKMEEAHTSSSSCCDVIIFISTDSPLIFLIVLDWFSFFKEITLQHTDNLHVRHSQKKTWREGGGGGEEELVIISHHVQLRFFLYFIFGQIHLTISMFLHTNMYLRCLFRDREFLIMTWKREGKKT